MAAEHNFLYAYLVRQLRTKEYFRLFLIEGHWNIPNNRLRILKKKKNHAWKSHNEANSSSRLENCTGNCSDKLLKGDQLFFLISILNFPVLSCRRLIGNYIREKESNSLSLLM